jgi:hypothetical protein
MSEITNKVATSGLIQMDLANYKPKLELIGLDLAPQLWEELILKEKDFRQWIKEHSWERYSKKAVYIYCSADAIIPVWAFMLISSKLSEHEVFSIVGTKNELEKALILKAIESVKLEEYEGSKLIVKGCSDIASPEFAMSEFIKHFQKAANSIMFGEPCSTVPVFKRKK